MSAALKAAGLKQILDFVPNHMGVGGADNPFLARRARMGAGFRLRGLVRHRLGLRPGLPPRQAAGADPRRTIWHRAHVGQADPEVRRPDRLLRGLGLRHSPAADLPRPLRADPRRRRRDPRPRRRRLLGPARLAPAGVAPRREPQGRAGRARARASRGGRGDRGGRRPPQRHGGGAEELGRPRCADPQAILARRAVPHRRRRHQLPPFLQHQRSRGAADGTAGGVRPRASPRRHHAARRHDRRAAHRPHRRVARPQGLPRAPARPRAGPPGPGALPRCGEDPRPRGAAAPRLARRRHHGIRGHEPAAGADGGPGQRGRVLPHLRRLRRWTGGLLEDSARSARSASWTTRCRAS